MSFLTVARRTTLPLTTPTRLRCRRSGLPVAPDSFSAPQLDEVSVTDWPVHALSVTRTEWVEMVWAARNAVQEGANLERRGWFEGVKCLLLERDLPPSKIMEQGC